MSFANDDAGLVILIGNFQGVGVFLTA